MNAVTTGARTTSNSSEFNRGAGFGTKGNESAAVPNHPIERSTAPDANSQPCYGAKKRTEYGTPPPKWSPSDIKNGGQDNC